jgi:hypothetical protein
MVHYSGLQKIGVGDGVVEELVRIPHNRPLLLLLLLLLLRGNVDDAAEVDVRR